MGDTCPRSTQGRSALGAGFPTCPRGFGITTCSRLQLLTSLPRKNLKSPEFRPTCSLAHFAACPFKINSSARQISSTTLKRSSHFRDGERRHLIPHSEFRTPHSPYFHYALDFRFRQDRFGAPFPDLANWKKPSASSGKKCGISRTKCALSTKIPREPTGILGACVLRRCPFQSFNRDLEDAAG